MDEETFESIARLEARIDAVRAAWLALVVILTHRNDDLLQSIETGLFGSFVDASNKNPHRNFQNELRDLGNELTSLRERRDESSDL